MERKESVEVKSEI